MTGCAISRQTLPNGVLNVELRCVNHRFLDISLKLADELRVFEQQVRDKLSRKIHRGKLDCRIYFSTDTEAAQKLQLNMPLLTQLLALNTQICTITKEIKPISIDSLLRWPGVLISDMLPRELIEQHCLSLLEHTLTELVAARHREGEQLTKLLIRNIGIMQQLISDIQPKLPVIIQTYQEKLYARLNEAMCEENQQRISHEIALFSQKIDVAEELTRLLAHLKEMQRLINTADVVGKRLDFLAQELHREANTLGAKSISLETTQISLELKVLIEQMREQIQNIE